MRLAPDRPNNSRPPLDAAAAPRLSCADPRAAVSRPPRSPQRRRILPMDSPADALLIFDFADRGGRPRRLCFRRPHRIIAAASAAEVRPALREVEAAVASGLYAAGYVGYEAAPAFDPALAVRGGSRLPLLWFGLFREPAPPPPPARGGYRLTGWSASEDRPAYERNFAAARAAIARGDTYQINYSFRLRARFRGDALAFYERLASNQRAAYCAYLDTGAHRILSASPELFFRWDGRTIETKPMKGTARRGLWPEEDEALGAWLAASEKNRAENVMIVDLMRNDLGRVARVGSVRVRDLCRVERYPTVFQMTSTVEARTRRGLTLEEVFAAAFPSGSVTGAPKVSTMRLIAALEGSPRGVYCGSVGLLTPGGEAVFNVAIRTVVIDPAAGEAEYGVGGGLTWDSVAGEEYEEALAKAAVLAGRPEPFRLLETMRLERGRYALLNRHLARLRASARYFDFPVSVRALRRALAEHAGAFPAGARRARLLLSDSGEVSVESLPLEELPAGPLPVALAARPVSRRDRFLYHKTTRREVYDSRRRPHPEAFDVLLSNEEGELTEFTTGNLVVELEGRRFTPPRESGLLAGVMRASLLERGEIAERPLTPSHLRGNPRMWLVNSVRGWVPVALEESLTLQNKA